MKIDYITFRDTGNAGDNLIGYTLQRLIETQFKAQPDWNVCHLELDDYAKCQEANILFGPGGVVTGSPDSSEPDRLFMKGLSHPLLDQWQAERRRVFCFGSGTNSSAGFRPFTAGSGDLLNHFVHASQYLYLRGHADIETLSKHVDREVQYKLRFQPCPSIFLDKIYGITGKLKNKVAVNLNFGNLTADEAKAHPIKRFNAHARTLGLMPVLFANHPVDKNDALAETFEGKYRYNMPTYSEEGLAKIRRLNKTAAFKNSAHQDAELANDFNGYRFAFGKRLHGFLPFISFGTVSVFMSNRAVRKRMPGDYFSLPELALPFNNSDPEGSVDRMIATLDYLVEHEARLRSIMQERREELWKLTQDNLYEMKAIYQAA